MEEPKQSNKEVKIATSPEERVASMLLDALENFNKYLDIALGIEEGQLAGGDSKFGGGVTYQTVSRRSTALIAAINSLKQVIRIARPNIEQVVDLTDPENDWADLGEARILVDRLLLRISRAAESETKTDDLVKEIEVSDGKYARYTYQLTSNFTEVITKIEWIYEGTYSIILKNGLLTELQIQAAKRSKLHGI